MDGRILRCVVRLWLKVKGLIEPVDVCDIMMETILELLYQAVRIL